MEERYWNEFMESGKVTDYLYSKGLGICSRIMEKYTCEAEKSINGEKMDSQAEDKML